MDIFYELSVVQKVLTICGTASVVGGFVVLYHMLSFVSARPNEWLLVLRKGKVVCAGVGASYYTSLGDQCVKFPSRINRFKFTASQITSEKQGIEVEGVLIWSVFREADGPLRAFRALGADLTAEVPANANETLREMSNSIVRHRIANSTIEDILTKRDQIRNEIREEMQKIVNGWGVWLESVEITDVRILSGTLFHNLQTEFREQQRSKAEIIKMNTDTDLEQKRTEQKLTRDNQAVLNTSKQQIFAASEALKVQQEKQKLFTAEQAVTKLQLAAEIDLKRHTQEAENELVLLKQELALRNTLARIENDKEAAKKQRELDALRELSLLEQAKNEVSLLSLKDTQKREAERLSGEMLNELSKGVDYNMAALRTAQEIYSHLSVKELKMINFSDGTGGIGGAAAGGGGGGDGVMQLVNKLVASCSTTTKEL